MSKKEKWVLRVEGDPDIVVLADKDFEFLDRRQWSDEAKRAWINRNQLKHKFAVEEVFMPDWGEADAENVTIADDAKDEEAEPPSSALLSALLPFSTSEDVIANLNELFADTWLPRHGSKTARRIWITQAVRLVVLQWAKPFLNLVDKLRGLLKLPG